MNKIDDEAYMKTQIENGLELKIVGVLRQKEGTSSGVNSPSGGVAYTSDLIDYTSEQIQNSDIVKSKKPTQPSMYLLEKNLPKIQNHSIRLI